MEFWFWFIIFVLFIMLMNAKSDINRLERQLNELAKRLKTIMPPAETEAEKRPEEEDDAEKQTALSFRRFRSRRPELPLPCRKTAAPPSNFRPRRRRNITFLGQKLITWIAGLPLSSAFFFLFYPLFDRNGLLGPVARLTAATLGGLLLTGAGCLLHYKQTSPTIKESEKPCSAPALPLSTLPHMLWQKSISWRRKAFLSR